MRSGAFSGEVDTGSSQKMRQNKKLERRVGWRFSTGKEPVRLPLHRRIRWCSQTDALVVRTDNRRGLRGSGRWSCI